MQNSDHVLSKDGTQIGYRRYGSGPGLVLVQGAIGTTENFHDLALYLARDFTVYVPERRGRPLSPRDYSPSHTIAKDVEDLEAVLERSGARFVFGLSSGAVIALETARVLPAVQKVVLFEAPLYVLPQQMRFDLVERLQREIGAGQLAAGMVTSLIASGLAPRPLTLLPRWLLNPLFAFVLRLEAKRKKPGEAALRDLVPSLRYDFKVVSGMQNRFETFRSVTSEVLLISGAKSRPYLRESAVALEQVLPNARHLEFADLDHSSPWNASQGGKPATVGKAIREFLLP